MARGLSLPAFEEVVAEELQAVQRERDAEIAAQGLPDVCDYVSHLSPRFAAPRHLEPMLRHLRKFREVPFQIVFSVPPRHGKSETLLHFVAWALRQDPTLRVCYVTYSMSLARKQALKVRALCLAAGVRMATKKVTDWTTPEGGGFLATGIGGMLTGVGVDILIVDDPTKDRATAESQVYRDKIWEWFTSTATTRLMPGASVIVCGTRWHEDDLQGRLVAGFDGSPPWECVNLPAIVDDVREAERLGRAMGSALWPELWPVELLEKRKAQVGQYDWASLFQGRPQPRGGLVFGGDAAYYDALPRGGFRIAVGLDLAYSEKTKRDKSAAVVGYYVPAEDNLYVVDVVTAQGMEAPAFKALLHALLRPYVEPGKAVWRWYIGGELGAAQFMRSLPNPIPVVPVHTTQDKFVRSIPYAAAWNSGRILLPSPKLMEAAEKEAARKGGESRYKWVNAFISEHKSFTGRKEGEKDDIVDAAVAMHDALRPLKTAEPGPPVRQFSHGPWEERRGE